MLFDFLSLEHFYGRRGAFLFLDDLLEKYDPQIVKQAFSKGYIERRPVCIGPDCGRFMCYLSSEGRDRVLSITH